MITITGRNKISVSLRILTQGKKKESHIKKTPILLDKKIRVQTLLNLAPSTIMIINK